ncbi:hypothetical protein EJ05DRAFT_490143 [Pseudovirgaria hyperparasitica]|uniref:C2 domain-containing protein n=1 Tax=Pseudovirgaria hyperparasitica TaxID=470096 RepID=A0A6A6VW22_9PEZI|nr:uncharacterized protein EJ05DRAFT_490143 [Pseudovirgaria hyperparasitica]KAF2753447.1 hypothetical protein EJ05DRAFT_490143 [Pseudovirgaria hyperparasitica]
MATRLAKPSPMGGAHTSGIYADMTVDGPEIGTLVAVFDRAKNLPNRRSMGKQDPYCAARLGKEAKKTNTDRRGGQTPRWDQELRFTVHDSIDYQTLKVSIFNDDKKTELIGETFVSLGDVIIPGGGKSDIWHGLNCKGRYAGEIRIELTYYDTRPKPEKVVQPRREAMRNAAAERQGAPMNGPRDAAPVKRRPLPANPVTGTPSPSGSIERPVPSPQNGPRGLPSAPRPQSHYALPDTVPAPKRHTFYEQTENNRQLPELAASPRAHHAVHSSQPDLHMPSETQQSYRPSQRSHGRDMYVAQPVDATHALPAHSTRPQSYMDLPHANSAPTVPTVHERRSLNHAHSEDYTHRQGSTPADEYHSPHNRHQSPLYQHEPEPEIPNWSKGYEEITQQNPFYNSEDARQHMQPTVEDELDVPPPPPVHRSSAPAIYQAEQQQYAPDYHAEMAPAPLRLSTSRDDMQRDPYGTMSSHNSDYNGNSPYERRYTQPRERPVSRDTSQPSPLRNELPSSLVPAGNRARQDKRMSIRGLTPSVSPQIQPYQSMTHDTPLHQQQHVSPQDYQTPPNMAYQTPPSYSFAHEEPSGQRSHYSASPTNTQYLPTEVPPMIKPRAVSPGIPSDPRTGRNNSRNMVPRKSVSPQPPTDRERRLSAVPFGPDDFDAFNPNTPGSSRSIAGGASSSAEDGSKESNGPIIGFDGRVIDPSDHLPVESYAPEPEAKGVQNSTPTRDRERLTGARGIGRRSDIAPSSAMSSSLVLHDSSAPTTPNSNGRNRLHKPRPGEYSASGTPNSAPNSGLRDAGHHTQYSPSPYAVGVRRDAGNRQPQPPPIPAKIPLGHGDDLARLSEEMSRIDIGAGNGLRDRFVVA